ncbi:uncharacterized protein LOC144917340 [Branchiostoma floridae x Branchiostoma belcheri]
MGCNSSKTKIRPLDVPLPQNTSWFGAKVKGQARKLRRKFMRCFQKDQKKSKKETETAESNVRVTAEPDAYMFVPTTTTFQNVHTDVVKLIILIIALARLLEFLFGINFHKLSNREHRPVQRVSRFRDLAKYPYEEPSRTRRASHTPPARQLAVLPPPPSYRQTTFVKKTREEILVEKNLSVVGYDRDRVATDGNCFFEAAARQLRRGDPRVVTTAQQLRQDLVRYIRAHAEKYSIAVPGGLWAFHRELDDLSRPGHWCMDLGDTLPIALANFTSREVNLVTSIPAMPVITLEPDGEESGSPLVLAYLDTPGGEHYDAVKRKRSD